MRRYAILAIAVLFVAVNANAVDLHGYFRNAVGGSSAGGDQVTFKNAGQEYKLRLGNEDNWSEFEFDQLLLKDKNGVEWSIGFMPGWGSGFNGANDIKGITGMQQEFVRATFPQLGGATVWGGQRYYHRHANDIIDFFYMNESNAGAGIEDLDMGFGKLAIALFRVNPGAEGNGVVYWQPDVRFEGIPVNPGGTLNIALLAKIRTWNKNLLGDKGTVAPDTQDFSPFIMVKHSQGGILNGGNNLAVTYKTGCFVGVNGLIKDASGGTDPKIPDCHKDLRELTVSEDLTLNPTKQFSIVLSGMFQNYGLPAIDGGSKKTTLNAYYVGTRPMFKVADHFAIQGDLGYFYNKTDVSGDKARTMIKGTIAPTITPFTDGFYSAHSAPEIRFYATYASWDKDQAKPGAGRGTTGNTFKGATEDSSSGFTFGTQVEAWF
jgi:maltoporin